MLKQALKILLSTFFLVSTTNIFGVPATPYPITRIQPDGTELTVYLKGDEFHKFELTLDGYLIKRDATGYYKYSKQDKSGRIISTGIQVNQIERRSVKEKQLINALTKFPNFSKTHKEKKMAKVAAHSDSESKQKTFPNSGSPKSLVILVNFKDVSFVTENPRVAFDNLLNQEGYSANGGTGSARDYFKVASFGASSPDFVVVGPYTLPNNREYYGKNDTTNGGDDDIRPRDMVRHACQAAANDGVNFTQFDTDGDDIVENVFIYYAGHNEAEGGPDESIWPHRWALEKYLILNGKKISGYACTSELRGKSGSNMCGIGTFCHEFGHVYGLPDYYITDSSGDLEHHTLFEWNIMDAGAYLNKGRTPPTYSAYDRFYLGWLTPILLNSPGDIVLNDLKSSNQAFIITQSGTHNLNGSNPKPLEFFTLENRQRTGWDAYLPNSGMLITRIYYNELEWEANWPNNRASAMGVDIMEADGIANESTTSGDPFPGSKNITSFSPTLRSGLDIASPLTEIKQINGVISFKFMGGKNPSTISTDYKSITPFSTVFGTPSAVQEFTISGTNIPDSLLINSFLKTNFELKRKDDPSNVWVKSLTLTTVDSILDNTTIIIRYNPIEPSFNEIHVDYLNFIVSNVIVSQGNLIGSSSRPVLIVPPLAKSPSSISLNGFTANWGAVGDATGYYLTVYNLSEGTTELKEGFNNGLTPPSGWKINASSLFAVENYAGDSLPSIHLSNTGDLIQTEEFDFPVTEFSFYIRSMGEASGTIKVEANAGQGWNLLENFEVTVSPQTVKTYHLPEHSNYKQFRIVFKKENSGVAIDDVSVKFAQQVSYVTKNTWMTTTSAPINLILPGVKYYYTVRASDKTYYDDSQIIKYENITGASNVISVILDGDDIVQYSTKNNSLAVFKDSDGTVVLDKSKVIGANTHTIYVYSSEGKLFKTIESSNDLVSLSSLSKEQFYIVRVGAASIKVVL